MSSDRDEDTSSVDEPLSDRLQTWLRADGPKSIGGLLDHFGPQAFAVAFVLLMAPSALPIPTGGVTHVFDVVTILLAFQLIVGRTKPWLPAKLRDRELKSLRSEKTQSRLVRPIAKVEKVARPRLARTLHSPPGRVVFGVLVIVLTLAAFIAPPFSGLDTLPALGVVVLSLGVLLTDALIAGIGVLIGVGGIGLMIALAGAITAAFGKIF
ncbi:MAG TPA: exopolysaccharide biosynthesis protein [Sporichthya sp.]|nr:exopolysaccharide biosynthesis protein [Sporichthya sp.]